MKHISILVPLGHSSLPNIDGTHQILSEVNNILKRMHKPSIFKVQLVGLSNEISQRNGLYIVHPEVLIQDVKKTDMIIIPAIHGDLQKVMEMNRDVVPWIIEQYTNGAELVSLCIGAFFLASTGLLKGKMCATHWAAANEFRKLFPDVNLVDDKILTEEDGIYTSGGAYSYLNMLVYLIEKYAGREIAIIVAKSFMIDIDRSSQSPFMIFQGQKTHEDEPVKKAQEFIESNFSDKITVDRLSEISALGRRSFERRFRKATSNTVKEYIQRVKVEAAKKSFETSRKNINEVMYDVGYTDSKSFRITFKNITGMTPIEYRNKYNKEGLIN
jgi:transcriptional regulator GlxA family with amidase domain